MAQVVLLPCPLHSVPTTEQEGSSNSSLPRYVKRLQTHLKVVSIENNLSTCSQHCLLGSVVWGSPFFMSRWSQEVPSPCYWCRKKNMCKILWTLFSPWTLIQFLACFSHQCVSVASEKRFCSEQSLISIGWNSPRQVCSTQVEPCWPECAAVASGHTAHFSLCFSCRWRRRAPSSCPLDPGGMLSRWAVDGVEAPSQGSWQEEEGEEGAGDFFPMFPEKWREGLTLRMLA